MTPAPTLRKTSLLNPIIASTIYHKGSKLNSLSAPGETLILLHANVLSVIFHLDPLDQLLVMSTAYMEVYSSIGYTFNHRALMLANCSWSQGVLSELEDSAVNPEQAVAAYFEMLNGMPLQSDIYESFVTHNMISPHTRASFDLIDSHSISISMKRGR